MDGMDPREAGSELLKRHSRDFPGGPVAKDLPCNATDLGSIPGWGTETTHPMGQLSLKLPKPL